MSGGDQIRDYLPIEKVVELITKVSIENDSSEIYNICSGNPQRLVDLVNIHIKQSKSNIKLNLGHYPYSVLEPMEFWGCNKKINHLI